MIEIQRPDAVLRLDGRTLTVGTAAQKVTFDMTNGEFSALLGEAVRTSFEAAMAEESCCGQGCCDAPQA